MPRGRKKAAKMATTDSNAVPKSPPPQPQRRKRVRTQTRHYTDDAPDTFVSLKKDSPNPANSDPVQQQQQQQQQHNQPTPGRPGRKRPRQEQQQQRSQLKPTEEETLPIFTILNHSVQHCHAILPSVPLQTHQLQHQHQQQQQSLQLQQQQQQFQTHLQQATSLQSRQECWERGLGRQPPLAKPRWKLLHLTRDFDEDDDDDNDIDNVSASLSSSFKPHQNHHLSSKTNNSVPMPKATKLLRKQSSTSFLTEIQSVALDTAPNARHNNVMALGDILGRVWLYTSQPHILRLNQFVTLGASREDKQKQHGDDQRKEQAETVPTLDGNQKDAATMPKIKDPFPHAIHSMALRHGILMLSSRTDLEVWDLTRPSTTNKTTIANDNVEKNNNKIKRQPRPVWTCRLFNGIAAHKIDLCPTTTMTTGALVSWHFTSKSTPKRKHWRHLQRQRGRRKTGSKTIKSASKGNDSNNNDGNENDGDGEITDDNDEEDDTKGCNNDGGKNPTMEFFQPLWLFEWHPPSQQQQDQLLSSSSIGQNDRERGKILQQPPEHWEFSVHKIGELYARCTTPTSTNSPLDTSSSQQQEQQQHNKSSGLNSQDGSQDQIISNKVSVACDTKPNGAHNHDSNATAGQEQQRTEKKTGMNFSHHDKNDASAVHFIYKLGPKCVAIWNEANPTNFIMITTLFKSSVSTLNHNNGNSDHEMNGEKVMSNDHKSQHLDADKTPSFTKELLLVDAKTRLILKRASLPTSSKRGAVANGSHSTSTTNFAAHGAMLESLRQSPGGQFTLVCTVKGIRLYHTQTLQLIKIFGEGLSLHGHAVVWKDAHWLPKHTSVTATATSRPSFDETGDVDKSRLLSLLHDYCKDFWIMGVPHPLKEPRELRESLHFWNLSSNKVPACQTFAGPLRCGGIRQLVTVMDTTPCKGGGDFALNYQYHGLLAITEQTGDCHLLKASTWKSDFPGIMYPPGYQVLYENVDYIEDEDDLDQVIGGTFPLFCTAGGHAVKSSHHHYAQKGEIAVKEGAICDQESIQVSKLSTEQSTQKRDKEHNDLDILDVVNSDTPKPIIIPFFPKSNLVQDKKASNTKPNSTHPDRNGFALNFLSSLPHGKSAATILLKQQQGTNDASFAPGAIAMGTKTNAAKPIRAKRGRQASLEALLKASIDPQLRQLMVLKQDWALGTGSIGNTTTGLKKNSDQGNSSKQEKLNSFNKQDSTRNPEPLEDSRGDLRNSQLEGGIGVNKVETSNDTLRNELLKNGDLTKAITNENISSSLPDAAHKNMNIGDNVITCNDIKGEQRTANNTVTRDTKENDVVVQELANGDVATDDAERSKRAPFTSSGPSINSTECNGDRINGEHTATLVVGGPHESDSTVPGEKANCPPLEDQDPTALNTTHATENTSKTRVRFGAVEEHTTVTDLVTVPVSAEETNVPLKRSNENGTPSALSAINRNGRDASTMDAAAALLLSASGEFEDHNDMSHQNINSKVVRNVQNSDIPTCRIDQEEEVSSPQIEPQTDSTTNAKNTPAEENICQACAGRWVLHTCGIRSKPVDFEAVLRAEKEKTDKEEEEKKRQRTEKRKQADAKRREAKRKKKEEEKQRKAEEKKRKQEEKERQKRLLQEEKEKQRRLMQESKKKEKEAQKKLKKENKERRRADMLQRLQDEQQKSRQEQSETIFPPKTVAYGASHWPPPPSYDDGFKHQSPNDSQGQSHQYHQPFSHPSPPPSSYTSWPPVHRYETPARDCHGHERMVHVSYTTTTSQLSPSTPQHLSHWEAHHKTATVSSSSTGHSSPTNYDDDHMGLPVVGSQSNHIHNAKRATSSQLASAEALASLANFASAVPHASDPRTNADQTSTS